MRPLCVLVLALLLGPGCAAGGDKGPWDEFWKDLRGDNLEMRSGGPGAWGRTPQPEPPD